MIYVYNNDGLKFYDVFTFPAGEVGIKSIEPPSYGGNRPGHTSVHCEMHSSNDIIALGLVLQKIPVTQYIKLYIPYLPYGRNDKPHDSFGFGLKVFGDILNTITKNVKEIHTFTPHSDMTEALVNKLVVEKYTPYAPPHKIIIAPDQGAYKRLSKTYPNHSIISFSKVRDPLGNITSLELDTDPDLVQGREFVVIDDLCDGGATFINVAQKLRSTLGDKVESLELNVTHGIFSKGFDELLKYYDHIRYCNTYRFIIPPLPSGVEVEEVVFPYPRNNQGGVLPIQERNI